MDYVVVDRGFGECWHGISANTGKPLTKRTPRVVRFLEREVGVRGPGELYQHSCEIHMDGRNLCINPEHISIGTKSSNAIHMHSLIVGPWKGARPLGTKMAPEVGAKISAALKGKKKTPEHIAKMAAAQRGKKRGPRSPEAVEKTAGKLRGQKRTPEQRERMRQAALRHGTRTCDVCGKTTTVQNFSRHRCELPRRQRE